MNYGDLRCFWVEVQAVRVFVGPSVALLVSLSSCVTRLHATSFLILNVDCVSSVGTPCVVCFMSVCLIFGACWLFFAVRTFGGIRWTVRGCIVLLCAIFMWVVAFMELFWDAFFVGMRAWHFLLVIFVVGARWLLFVVRIFCRIQWTALGTIVLSLCYFMWIVAVMELFSNAFLEESVRGIFSL